MNTSLLEKILTSNYEYWVLKKDYKDRKTPSIIFCAIPTNVKRGLKREEIRLIDLENLHNTYYPNVFLNNEIPPFQINQNFTYITYAHPVTCNPKEFLKRALQLESNDIRDYVKLINELTEMQREILEDEAQHHRMNDMYTYTDDGFCDGFTK